MHEEFYKSLPKGRCNPCKYAKAVVAGDDFTFLGCYCEPYKGKWVAEIKDCPKVKIKAESEAKEWRKEYRATDT